MFARLVAVAVALALLGAAMRYAAPPPDLGPIAAQLDVDANAVDAAPPPALPMLVTRWRVAAVTPPALVRLRSSLHVSSLFRPPRAPSA